jgi:hypothetical protein
MPSLQAEPRRLVGISCIAFAKLDDCLLTIGRRFLYFWLNEKEKTRQ